MKIIKIILFVVFLAMPSLLRADPVMSNMGNELSASVQSLYGSAQKLSLGNNLLAVHINAANMKVNALQMRLKQYAAENNRLSDDALRLQSMDTHKARIIADLEKESFDIDAKIEELNSKIKADADMLVLMPEQEARFDERIKELGLSSLAKTTPSDPNATLKLQLLKSIDDSKRRQAELYEKIALKQDMVPEISPESPEDLQKLKLSIKQVQGEIDGLSRVSTPRENWLADNIEMKQLQQQVNALQKNHDELEGLMLRMQEKTLKMQKDFDKKAEYGRLKDSLDQIEKDAKRLKYQVMDLRVQMVDLDKRKTYLESLFKK